MINNMDKVLVILPTYNEAENIAQILKEVSSLSCDVLVIDDNSPDKTFNIVKDLQTQNKKIHLIKRSAKLGLGSAYREGFEWAINNNYSYVVEMDADFSHSVSDLEKMLQLRKSFGLVIGSRYVKGGRIEGWSNKRYYLSYFANKIIKILAFTRVNDLTGGFRIYGVDTLKVIKASSTKSEGYAFQVEMTINSIIKGILIKEIPITFRERREGKSKMDNSIIFEAILFLVKIPLKRLSNFFNFKS
jgi:dolichol-phosphate mannosyltransferase